MQEVMNDSGKLTRTHKHTNIDTHTHKQHYPITSTISLFSKGSFEEKFSEEVSDFRDVDIFAEDSDWLPAK